MRDYKSYSKKCFDLLKSKLLNESKLCDYRKAFRYYNIKSGRFKYFEPADVMVSKNQLKPRNYGDVSKSPSRHPWLENMRYLFREIFKSDYNKLINFLDWCISLGKSPFRGYLKDYYEQKRIEIRVAKSKTSSDFSVGSGFGSQDHLVLLFKDKKIGSIRSVLSQLKLTGDKLKKAVLEIKSYMASSGYAPVGIFKGKFSSYPVFYITQIKSAIAEIKTS